MFTFIIPNENKKSNNNITALNKKYYKIKINMESDIKINII